MSSSPLRILARTLHKSHQSVRVIKRNRDRILQVIPRIFNGAQKAAGEIILEPTIVAILRIERYKWWTGLIDPDSNLLLHAPNVITPSVIATLLKLYNANIIISKKLKV